MKRLVIAVAVLLFASVASAQYPYGMQYRGWSPTYGYMYNYGSSVPYYYQPRIRAQTYHYGNYSETTIKVRPDYGGDLYGTSQDIGLGMRIYGGDFEGMSQSIGGGMRIYNIRPTRRYGCW